MDTANFMLNQFGEICKKKLEFTRQCEQFPLGITSENAQTYLPNA